MGEPAMSTVQQWERVIDKAILLAGEKAVFKNLNRVGIENFNLVKDAVRKRVTQSIMAARALDDLMGNSKAARALDNDRHGPKTYDPEYPEEWFIAIEMLGYGCHNVDAELVYSFLMHMNAERVRPNTFIYQWAQWRKHGSRTSKETHQQD